MSGRSFAVDGDEIFLVTNRTVRADEFFRQLGKRRAGGVALVSIAGVFIVDVPAFRALESCHRRYPAFGKVTMSRYLARIASRLPG